MAKTIFVLLWGGALMLTVPTAFAQISQEEFTVVNPTSKAKLWATVFYPADAGADKKYPAVVVVPGGLGFGSGAARTPEPFLIARAGFVIGYFDPDGRGRSEGQENWNGKVHQDGLHAFLKFVAGLKFVDKSNIGVVSSSLGLAMAAGTLGRYPDDPPVKYFIDNEGPSDRFYITKFDDPFFSRIFPRSTKDEDWWAEREAVHSIKEIRCVYLRIQKERDHVHGENKQHAIDMINAATHTKFGGKGKSPWTRINGAENPPNCTYTKDTPPRWLPARVGPPLPDEILRWMQEMSAKGEGRKPALSAAEGTEGENDKEVAKTDIRGTISHVNPADEATRKRGYFGSILVEGKKEPDTQYDKASIRITAKTRIEKMLGKERKPARFEELTVGCKVQVVFTGPVAESYPVQATAQSVLVVQEAQ